MREHIFRGKRIDNGEWVYGDILQAKIPKDTYYITNNVCIGLAGIFQGNIYEIEKETIGEYTGLTDKNGTQIFEGDVIKNKDDMVWVVEYHRAAFQVKRPQTENTFVFEDLIFSKDYEVIGNIHDKNYSLGDAKNE